jgi:hypothetical protein
LPVRLTRRRFIAVSAGAAAGAAIPGAVAKWVGQAALADSPTMYFLTDATRAATCASACERIVPTGPDPTTDPGATEAAAVVFIDRFLAAFQADLAAGGAGPPIWLAGPFSNRNPWPDDRTGEPTSEYPADSFYSDGQMHALPLTTAETYVWKTQLYGFAALPPVTDPVMGKWSSQVRSGLIPGVPSQGLRQIYADGLDALDTWSQTVTGRHFAEASPEQQDLMLAAAGNVVLAAVAPQITSNLPPGFPQVAPPAAAQALYPVLVTHTFQACYGLPEYRQLDSNPLWKMIGYDGDTLPLGNSVYGSSLDGDNEGFGTYPTIDHHVYRIRGGYNEYRPVSYISGDDSSALTPAQAQQMVQFLKKGQSR